MDPNKLIIILYGVLVGITFLALWHRRRYYKLSRQFPGPIEWPFMGMLHYVINPENVLPILKDASNIFESPTLFTYLGPQAVLYTTDYKLLQKIFTSAELYNKPDIIYNPLSNLFGDGLFSTHESKWQKHRRLINPSFRITVLRQFLPIFNKNAIAFRQKFENMVGNNIENLNEILQQLTLTAAVETILGYKIQKGTEVDQDVVQAYSCVIESTIYMMILNVIKLSSIAKHLNFIKSRNAVFRFVNKLLKERQEAIILENNNDINDAYEDDIYMTKNNRIFIDQALKQLDTKQFNWQDVNDESNSIIFGAFDTTASAIYFTLVFLAMHSDVQEKVYEEILSVFPDKDFYVDFDVLKNECKYLDMVIDETLRLAPSVPVIGRGVAKDVKLNDDITLPKGLVILINIFQVHRNVKIWGPRADQFNPDHFLPENVRKRSPYAYMPFSKGIRNCIGGRYALMAIKIVLLHTLRNFRFTTDHKFQDLHFLTNITLKVKKFPTLTVQKRTLQ